MSVAGPAVAAFDEEYARELALLEKRLAWRRVHQLRAALGDLEKLLDEARDRVRAALALSVVLEADEKVVVDRFVRSGGVTGERDEVIQQLKDQVEAVGRSAVVGPSYDFTRSEG